MGKLLNKKNLGIIIALKQVQGLGNKRLIKLLNALQTPEKILNANVEILEKNVPLKVAQNIKLVYTESEEISKEVKKLGKIGVEIVLFNSKFYPEMLKEISDPPAYLYVLGDKKVLNGQCIAIVGTRNPSDEGKEQARKIAKQLSENNHIVVSGLAKGIDTAAHQGALDAIGKTIAVVGCGLANDYLNKKQDIIKEIKASGALISEYPPSEPASKYNLLGRNRIIAGLSKGVLIVESNLIGGTMSTAKWAEKEDRPIFVLPEKNVKIYEGPKKLLARKKAKEVSNAKEILQELENKQKKEKQLTLF